MLLRPSETAVHRIGEILTKDFQNGVTVAVVADDVTLTVMRDGRLFHRVLFDPGEAMEMAGFFKTGADRLVRQGGSGLGDAVRAEETVYQTPFSSIIIPGVTLGGLIPVGDICFGGDWKNAVAIMIRGNMLVFRIFKNGLKHYEIEFGINQCEQMAEFFQRAADRVSKSGASNTCANSL